MSEVLDKVREKWPAYDTWSDEDLAFAVGNKWPIYRQKDPEFDAEFKEATASRGLKVAEKTTGKVVSTLEAGAEASEAGRKQARFERLEAEPVQDTTSSLAPVKPPEFGLSFTPNEVSRLIAGMPQEFARRQQQREQESERKAEEEMGKSVIGVSGELVPSGADTAVPALTIPLSSAAKATLGVAGYMTSRQGMLETGAAAVPITRPAVFLKWAYDMIQSGITSAKDIRDELALMITDAFSKRMISANALGPPPKGVSTQQHIQNIADDVTGIAFGALGLKLGVHGIREGVGVVKGFEPPARALAGQLSKQIGETKLPPNVEALAARGGTPVEQLVKAADQAAFVGAPMTSEALKQVARQTLEQPAPTEEKPSALHPEAAQPVRDVREKPRGGEGEMPPEGRRKEDDEGRGKAPATPEAVAAPEAKPDVFTSLEKTRKEIEAHGYGIVAKGDEVYLTTQPARKIMEGKPMEITPDSELEPPIRKLLEQYRKDWKAGEAAPETKPEPTRPPPPPEKPVTTAAPPEAAKPPEKPAEAAPTPAAAVPEAVPLPGTPEGIAKSLGLRFNGTQKGAKTVPDKWLFTMPKEHGGSTFGVDVGTSLEEIKRRAEAAKAPEKPTPETIAKQAQAKAIESSETPAEPNREAADKEIGRKLTDEEFAKIQDAHKEGVSQAKAGETKAGGETDAQAAIEKPAAAPPAPVLAEPAKPTEVKETEDELRRRTAAAERQPVEGAPPVDVGQRAGAGEAAPPTGEAGGAPGPEVPGGAVSGREAEAGRAVGEPGVGGGAIPSVEPGGRPGEQRGAPGAPVTEGEAAGVERPGRREPVKPEDRNHVLPADREWIPSGQKAKARANIDAIKLLKKLEAENRNPTPEEKEVLAQFVGWGALKPIFDEGKAAYRERDIDSLYENQRKEYQNWEKAWGKLYDEVKKIMTPEEWDAAASSILNAHFTSRTAIVHGLWNAIHRLGFRGGIALEAGAGIGNVIGLQPEPSRAGTRWVAIEKDQLTARLLAKLYPEAKVQPVPFEKARIPNNSVDLVAGNFPFDKDGPHDPRYPEFSLHNYFFARALDVLKPGGILAAITSDSTMDSPSSKAARLYMAERADLIGAIRLPNNAFKENAGTEVTTDILFFRKRDGTPFEGKPFTLTVEGQTYKKEAVDLNEYFEANPDMMLGRMSLEGTMYGPKQPALLPKPGQDLGEALKGAVEKLPDNAFGAQQIPGEAPPELGEAVTVKPGLLTIRDGKPVVASAEGTFEPMEWADNKKKVEQAKSYVGVRESTRSLIDLMREADSSDEDVAAARVGLNALYDAYRKKYGAFNERKSKFLADADVDFPVLMALEDANTRTVEGIGATGKKWTRKITDWAKAGMFTKRTVFPRNPPEHVDTVVDGYNVSMNFRGRVDPDWISQLTGKTVDAVKSDLRETGTAFQNPKTGQWEPSWRYLSGPVREKLNEARRFASDNPEFQPNVAALEKVQPEARPFELIDFALGSTFISPKTVQDFVREKLGLPDAEVQYVEKTGTWLVDPKWTGAREALNTTTFGIHGVNGHEMVRLALNLQAPSITKLEDRVSESGKTYQAEVKDPVRTIEAEAKQAQIKAAFMDWVKSNPEAAKDVETGYNLKNNGSRVPTYEPPTWTHYPGASSEHTLRPHQMRVVTRMLQDSTLLAHAVGTGKTWAMVTAAMEMRRLGTAKKPLIVVQNSTIEQFAAQFKRLYPTAKILVPSEKQRSADARNSTMVRIATGDWDAVIIPHSFMDMLPDDPERQKRYISDQLREMKDALIEAEADAGKNSPKAANIQRRLNTLQKMFDDLLARKVDKVMKFEELGVDALFVDEAHAYKKLQFTTKMDSVKGLDTSASQRGLSMLMKVRHVQEKNQGKNVIFSTGTPVSNTITEIWNMMRFVRPDVLKEFGIEDFDSFAANFGHIKHEMEMTSVGTWKMENRFAEYINPLELITAWRSVADVVSPEEVNLPGLPAIRVGKAQPVNVKQTPLVQAYISTLKAELEHFQQASGRWKRENSHIPLTVFTRAKKATLDMRLIDPTHPEEPNSKIAVLADNVARIYRDSTPVKGVQAIFADLYKFTDKKTNKVLFNLYDAIKQKLIAQGVPEKEILIVDDKLKGASRESALNQLNEGEIRVAIGSTGRLGTGLNFQKHAIAAHHMDAPPRPMDIEQRNGRVYRQNNQNPTIDIFSYGVENTLDASLYQRLHTKQKFTDQVMRGKVSGRRFEDSAQEYKPGFDELMAEFSGDPRTREKVFLENELRVLEAQREGHYSQVRQARVDAENLKDKGIPYTEANLAEAKSRAEQVGRDFGDIDKVNLQFGERVFSGKKEATAHLDERFKAIRAEAEKIALEENSKHESKKNFTFPAKGFKFGTAEVELKVEANVRPEWEDEAKTKLKMGVGSQIAWNLKGEHWGGAVNTGSGFYSSFQGMLERILKQPQDIAEDLESKKRQLRQLDSFAKTEFDRENEFKNVADKYSALLADLGLGPGKAVEKPPTEVMPLGFELERPKKPLSVQRTQIKAMLDRIDYLREEEDMLPGYKEGIRAQLQERLREIEAEMMKGAKGEEPPPEIIGMGGAIPKEYEPGKGTGTATRNAKIDEERMIRGLDPLMSRLRAPWKDVWDKAMGRIDREFDVQDNLIKELQATPRTVSDEENALLLHRKVDLKNMYERATREMVDARDDGRDDDARRINIQVNEWSDKLGELEQVLRDVGSKTGQALAARNMVVNDDFSLGALDLRLRGAKGGKPLTDAERAELIKIADDYKTENAKLQQTLAERDKNISTMEAERKVRELEAEARKKTAPSDYVMRVAERWVAEWDKRGDAALARIRAKLGRVSIGLDPTLLVDLVELGIARFGHIGLDFAKWSAQMIDDVGELVRPHLEDIWEKTQKAVDQKGQEEPDEEAREKIKDIIYGTPTPKPVRPPRPVAPPPTVPGAPVPKPVGPPRPKAPAPKPDRTDDINKLKDKIQNKVDKGAIDQIGPFVNKLARMFVEDGTTDRDILIDQVHDILADIIPDWGRRDTMDAISGYGKFTQLEKDAVSVKLRDLKGQMQQVGKLEDMAGQIAPKKTGMERREASDEERRLIKEVNEMKKKAGFQVTDPATQLKSALQSAKTRIENLIADLKLEIKTRERIVKSRTPITPDPTLTRLRKELEDIRTEHEKVFQKKDRAITDAQRIAGANRALDKAIGQLQADLEAGRIYREKVPSKTPVTPELEAKRAKLAELQAQRDELRKLANPAATPEERALAAIKSKLANQLMDLHRRMAEGDFTKRARRATPVDQQTMALRESVERIKKRFNEKVRQAELENRKPWQKWLDKIVRWERAFKLSSPTVFGKLSSAAITRVAATMAEESVGTVLSAAMPTLARQAPREGGGLNAKAAAKALAETVNKGMDDAAKTARTGESQLDILHGQKLIDRDWANLFGQWHGAMKAPVKRAEFTYSLEKRIEHAIKTGVDPTDELVLQRLSAEAYDDALRSIFMQRGFTSDAFNAFVTYLERQKKYPVAGEVSARFLRFMLPVVRVPINIVAETATGVYGAPVASLRTLSHVINGTLGNLEPKVADSIMRQFKKGSIGLGLMAIGYLTPGFAGGYYSGEKRKPGEPQFGGFQIAGVDIPRWMTHAPWFELMQIGATIRRVKEQHVKKTGEEKGLTEGMWAAGLGLIEQTPFIGQMLRFDKLFRPRERTQYMGELAKSTVVPGAVQKLAEFEEYAREVAEGKRKPMEFAPTPRKPSTVPEYIATGVPFARELVPEKTDSKPYKPK